MTSRIAQFIDVEDPATRRWTPVDVAIWAGWTATVIVLVSFHEMWRDELQAWAIARDSTWPWELIRNTSYEGHPPGWHLVLWAASLATRSPVAMQVVSVACVSAAAWLVLRYLPFARPVRVLLLFGYYPLFEMGVIARSYSLLFLLVVGVVVLSDRSPIPLAATVALLVAVSLTLVHAIPLVCGLSVGIAIRHREVARRHLVAAGAVLVIMVLVSGQLVRPPRGDGRRLTIEIADADRAQYVITGPIRALLPWFELNASFWGRFATDGLGVDERVLGLAVLVVVIFLLRRSPAAVAVWIIGAGGYLAAAHVFTLPMEPRHLSILWLTLVAAAWFAGSEAVSRPASDERSESDVTHTSVRTERRINGWVIRVLGTAVLLASVVGVVWPAGSEVRYPFSNGDAAVAWIRDQTETNPAVYCAALVYVCSSVAIRLDEPSYSRSDVDPFTYVVWRSGWRRRVAPELVAADALRLEEALGRRVVVVAARSDYPPGCDLGWVGPPTLAPEEEMVICFADELPAADAVGG